MPRENHYTRSILFDRAYYLIIDICSLMDTDFINDIVNIVSDTISLACASRGVARIPYFGLASINLEFSIIWNMNRVKGNFSKIMKSLDTLRKIPVTGNLSEEVFLDYLHFGLKQIVNDINKLKNTPRSEEISDSRMITDIILLTKKEGFPIKYYLSTLLDQLDVNQINKIQIIELSDAINYNLIDDGILQLIQMKKGERSLERLFKGWLVDVRSDREDLIMRLGDDEMLCDVEEIMMDPGLIPFSQAFHIHKEITNSSFSHLPDAVMPVYRLEVIERISSSGLSENSVFGYPLRIRPTRSSKYSVSTNSSNTEKFVALCKILYDADEYLIARLDNSDSPKGYFVLMPGEGVFLIKSLVSRELMLPTESIIVANHIISDSDVDYEVRLAVSNSLFNLPLSDEFNPTKYRSDICSALTRQLRACRSNNQLNTVSEINSVVNKSKYSVSNGINKLTNSKATKTISKKRSRKSSDMNFLKHLASFN